MQMRELGDGVAGIDSSIEPDTSPPSTWATGMFM